MSIDTSAGETTSPSVDAGPDEARRASEHVERLLEEVHATTSPQAWQTVEALVQALVALYGDGLSRLVALLVERGVYEDALQERLADDELLGSLLALHGLHPQPPELRIRRALDDVAAKTGAIQLALEGGVARLRVLDGGPASLGKSLERLVQEAAPEVERVLVDGLRAPAAAGEPLVQIDLARSRAGSG
jgi:hypothetical protein